ncbi:unnamed protein product [Choristocarpus tenellus]
MDFGVIMRFRLFFYRFPTPSNPRLGSEVEIVSLVMEGLPRPHPFAMELGSDALEAARIQVGSVLNHPLLPGSEASHWIVPTMPPLVLSPPSLSTIGNGFEGSTQEGNRTTSKLRGEEESLEGLEINSSTPLVTTETEIAEGGVKNVGWQVRGGGVVGSMATGRWDSPVELQEAGGCEQSLGVGNGQTGMKLRRRQSSKGVEMGSFVKITGQSGR